jgi:hypothetical protein
MVDGDALSYARGAGVVLARSTPCMTLSYSECAECHRLVKAADRACPFCEATTMRARAHLGVGSGAPRVSRAGWLAIASSVAAFGAIAAGCSDGKSTPESNADAGTDAAFAQLTVPACAPPDGGLFACGEKYCRFPDEYCDRVVTNICDYQSGSTVSESNTCRTKHVCSCSAARRLLFPPPGDGEPLLKCDDVDGGGVLITADKRQFCGACYGAPPSRLERFARPSVA